MKIVIIHPSSDIRCFTKRMKSDEYAIIIDRADKSMLIFDNLSGEFEGSEEMGDDTAWSLN